MSPSAPRRAIVGRAPGGEGRRRAGRAAAGRCRGRPGRRRHRHAARSQGGRELRRRGRPRRRCSSSTATRRRTSRSWRPGRTAPRRTTSRASARSRGGDVVVMDFGGALDGYFSDTTRTVVVGEPTEEQRARPRRGPTRAGARAVAAVRPGVRDRRGRPGGARRDRPRPASGTRFIHRTGHGIGIEVHEPPYAVEGDGTGPAARDDVQRGAGRLPRRRGSACGSRTSSR